jgi:hypothetical protein
MVPLRQQQELFQEMFNDPAQCRMKISDLEFTAQAFTAGYD